MVTLECLDAFDHLIWLRTGARAAEAMGCNQSTISRHASKCQLIFNLKLRRSSAEWNVVGDTDLLAAERCLHQSYRWEMGLPLRLEAQHWMREFYDLWRPQGWYKGNFNYLEYERPMALLRDRVIDAWLCSAPDVPRDPELACLQLFEVPMRLLARPEHPLCRRRSPLSLQDVAAYPLQPLPPLAFPVFESRLAALGLSGPATTAQVPPEAEGLSFEERMLEIGSSLTLSSRDPEYRVLPVEIPIQFGDVLVIRSEFATHRRCRELLDSLSKYIRVVTAGCPDVKLLDPQALLSPVPASRRDAATVAAS